MVKIKKIFCIYIYIYKYKNLKKNIKKIIVSFEEYSKHQINK